MNTFNNGSARAGTAKHIRNMMLGLDAPVELGNKTKASAINLDNAATTPAFKNVVQEIHKELLYYSSIGRGMGQKSEHTNEVYDSGRDTVLDFVGADSTHYTVFYVNNTTDGMNKLASALIDSHRDMVLTTRMEHHANDLTWRLRARTVYTEVDKQGRLILEDFERILRRLRGRVKYVSVTAASNVTGYVNDVHQIARTAHKYGAKIIVDGAQIIAHRAFRMTGDCPEENIDFLVFSAHKMYSPFGGGAVVGLTKELNRHVPRFYGGGMIETVTDRKVFFTDSPDLYEAGSPNYPGVVGMLRSMKNLQSLGFDYIEAHEQRLLGMALDGLRQIPGVILYGDSIHYTDRVGILVFTLQGIDNETVSRLLAEYSGIAVRHAAFCAHPYVRRLTGDLTVRTGSDGTPLPPEGLVRVSFGIYNTEADVQCLVNTVKQLLESHKEKSIACNNSSNGRSERRCVCDRC